MSNNKKWSIVGIYTLLILVSLPWARQIWDFFIPKSGQGAILCLFLGCLTLAFFHYRNIFLIGVLGIIIIIIFRQVHLPIERFHFIEYGVLGWLSYWAGGKKGFIHVIIYVILIGMLDEFIQKSLPTRVFDVRDILINIIGGGIGIFLGWYERKI